MAFDPTQLPDDSTFEGNLANEPMAELLSTVIRSKATGRIFIQDEVGPNCLYFMQGRPVGVMLSQVIHPLGQLLLELGKVDSAQFVKAQRLIGDGERLPGQVFMEIGAITEADLKETLAVQARRKAQKFVQFQACPYEFNKGLSFLTGFKSVPMEGPPLIYFAMAAAMDGMARQLFLESFADKRVKVKGAGLGAPLEAFGFGRAEERFLHRLTEWHSIHELDQFGTLPREDMAAVLKFLDGVGTLEVADPAPPKPVAPPPPAPKPVPAPPRPAPARTNSGITARQAAATMKRPEAYGPSPNAGSHATRKRSIDGDGQPAAAEGRTLPSVLVDYEALGMAPPARR